MYYIIYHKVLTCSPDKSAKRKIEILQKYKKIQRYHTLFLIILSR